MLFQVTGLNAKGKQVSKDIRAGSKQEILNNKEIHGFMEIIHTKQKKG